MNELPYEGPETKRVMALAKLLVSEHAKKEGKESNLQIREINLPFSGTSPLAQVAGTSTGPALQLRRLQDDEYAPIVRREVTPKMIAQRRAAADKLLAKK